MVWTVFTTHVRRLLHNRVELLLTFVVPVVFFSVFALIFARGVGMTPRVRVAIVDEAATPVSGALSEAFAENPGLRLMPDGDGVGWTRREAERSVRRGGVSMAIVLHEQRGRLAADLLADSSDQVAGQVVEAIVTRGLAMGSLPGRPGGAGLAGASGRRGPAVSGAPAETGRTFPGAPSGRGDVAIAQAGFTDADSLAAGVKEDVETAATPRVRVVDVMGDDKANPVISMYAAGIAVMFLLFGATTGGGVLLEEKESHTLERLLSTRLTMDQLLLGKWFYLTAVGIVQVTVMFVWGQAVFGVDLRGHFDGFAMMTLVTASAAAAFGLLLATLCKTRGQLNALAVIVVLTMSALGGSMVPRYVMSPELRQAGLWTFNAWALDGYDKVFWRDLPAAELSPQLGVLAACGFGFLVVARLMAMRWETE